MKKCILILVTAVFCLGFASLAAADVIGNARLSLAQGDVLVQTKDTGNEWAAASINEPLMPGDTLWVPENGRAEIQFLGGSCIRADMNTSVDITKVRRDSEGNITQVVVPQGRTYINYKVPPARDSVFQVDTPVVSAMAYGPAKFDIRVYEDGYTEVAVIDGVVYVEGQYGNTKVERGSMLTIGNDRNAELTPRRPKDEWIGWNTSRDSFFVRVRASSRYLPPALDGYSSDFDKYGRWVNTSDYGYVWSPTVVVSDWAPYRTGRWVWVNDDYVWVSYEPWGWAPYHYGRWAFGVGIGWFWVPPAVNAAFWSPGFVAWIHTPTYVSWVPLAPGEIYYGYGYYGPHSVNLTKVNIKNINVTNVYVNSRVGHAVTVVNKETFINGRSGRFHDAPANPFIAGVKVSPGRPDIKPAIATAMPLPTKVVKERFLPPRKVIETVKTSAIRERPVAVHKNFSVFRSGQPAPSMHVQKVDRPKPVTPLQKREMSMPRKQREISDMPAHVLPQESVREVPKHEREKVGTRVQREIKERPGKVISEESGRGIDKKQREVSKPKVQRGIKEIPEKGLPKESERKVLNRRKGEDKEKVQKEFKEKRSRVISE